MDTDLILMVGVFSCKACMPIIKQKKHICRTYRRFNNGNIAALRDTFKFIC